LVQKYEDCYAGWHMTTVKDNYLLVSKMNLAFSLDVFKMTTHSEDDNEGKL
jgi:hypothetical protein